MTDPAPGVDEDRVEQILEAWFRARHAGEVSDLEALCVDAPELMPRVQRVLDRHAALLGSGGEPEPRQPLLTDQLGDYRLKASIGRGGMGEVFLARQESLGRLVALKVLRPEHATEPARRIRFRREAEITAALDHPNIVPVFETGEQDGHVYIAMKLLDGETLDRIPGPWDARRLAAVGARVARALHAAHEVGVVHRDVKPANILLDGDHPYVLDFGLARARVDLTLTHEGHVPGTLAFMAPEQLQGGAAALDPRVDVYALGATLYTCLAGRPPFLDERPESLVRRILAQEPEPIRGPSGQRDLETILLRALDKEAALRFSTAQEMAEDLERFTGGYSIRARRTGIARRVYKLVRRHRVASAVAGVVLVAIAALGLLLWDNIRADRAERAWQVAQVRIALEVGRAADALQQIRTLQRRHPDDPEVADLEGRAVTTLQQQALLDELQADRRYLDLRHLEALDADLAGGHGDVLAESRTALARLFLAYYGEDQVRAGGLLGDQRIVADFPRTRAVLGALLAGEDPVASLGSVEGTSRSSFAADDHVFASVVLRIAEAPLQAVEAELLAAQAIDGMHPRAAFGLALVHVLRKRPELAWAELIGLVREGVPRPEAHVMLARIATQRRNFHVAEGHLVLADQMRIKNERPPLLRIELARLQWLMLQGSLEQFDGVLEGAREYWGDVALLAVLEGYAHSMRGDLVRARTSFESAAATAKMPWNERRARAALLGIKVIELLERPPESASIEDEVTASIAQAVALRDAARAAHDATIEAEVLVDLYHLQYLSGDVRESRASLRAALTVEDRNPDANYLFVVEAFECVANGELGVDGAGPVDMAREACTRAQGLVQRAESDPTLLQPTQLVEVLTYATSIAVALDDRDFAVRFGGRASELVETVGRDDLVRLLAESLGKLGLAEWPRER